MPSQRRRNAADIPPSRNPFGSGSPNARLLSENVTVTASYNGRAASGWTPLSAQPCPRGIDAVLVQISQWIAGHGADLNLRGEELRAVRLETAVITHAVSGSPTGSRSIRYSYRVRRLQTSWSRTPHSMRFNVGASNMAQPAPRPSRPLSTGHDNGRPDGFADEVTTG